MLKANKLVRQFEKARYEILYCDRWRRWDRQPTGPVARRTENTLLHSAAWHGEQLCKKLGPDAYGREHHCRFEIGTN